MKEVLRKHISDDKIKRYPIQLITKRRDREVFLLEFHTSYGIFLGTLGFTLDEHSNEYVSDRCYKVNLSSYFDSNKGLWTCPKLEDCTYAFRYVTESIDSSKLYQYMKGDLKKAANNLDRGYQTLCKGRHFFKNESVLWSNHG